MLLCLVLFFHVKANQRDGAGVLLRLHGNRDARGGEASMQGRAFSLCIHGECECISCRMLGTTQKQGTSRCLTRNAYLQHNMSLTH